MRSLAMRRWMTMASAVLSAGLGCDILRAEEPPPSEPDAYGYEVMFFNTVPRRGEADHRPPQGSVLALDGEPLAKHGERFALGPDRFLTADGTTLTATYETTCGPETIALDVPAKYDVAWEKAKRRENFDAWSQKTYRRQPASEHMPPAYVWSLKAKEPQAPHWVELYVDNTGRDRPATVTLGTIERTVAAGQTATIATTVGHCPEARQVRLGGEVIGQADWTTKKHKRIARVKRGAGMNGNKPLYVTRQGYLLDVNRDHCYVSKVDYYSTDPWSAGTPPKPIRVNPTAKPTVVDVGPVDNLFKPNPPGLAPGRSTGSMRSLRRVRCR